MPSDPAMVGPMRLLDSNVSSVTAAGNRTPTAAKTKADFRTNASLVRKVGAKSQKAVVEATMLIAAPTIAV